jgi:hypothetical protein
LAIGSVGTVLTTWVIAYIVAAARMNGLPVVGAMSLLGGLSAAASVLLAARQSRLTVPAILGSTALLLLTLLWIVVLVVKLS